MSNNSMYIKYAVFTLRHLLSILMRFSQGKRAIEVRANFKPLNVAFRAGSYTPVKLFTLIGRERSSTTARVIQHNYAVETTFTG